MTFQDYEQYQSMPIMLLHKVHFIQCIKHINRKRFIKHKETINHSNKRHLIRFVLKLISMVNAS